MSAAKEYDPDVIGEDTIKSPINFDDLTERFALKIKHAMRPGGNSGWELFQRTFGIADLRMRTGILPIAYRLEAQVTDTPLLMGTSFQSKAKVGLCRAGEGEDARIISYMSLEASGMPMGGGHPVPAGRCEVHHVFTRPFGPKEQRRVNSLEGLGFSKALPTAKIDYLTAQDVLQPQEGFEPLGKPLGDLEPHVWPYGNTDPNQHVHMMDYVGFALTFVTDQLARLGEHPDTYFFERLRVVYGRPFFTGDFYHRCGRAYRLSASKDRRLCFAGAFYKSEGVPGPEVSPSVAFQVSTAPKPRGGALKGGTWAGSPPKK